MVEYRMGSDDKALAELEPLDDAQTDSEYSAERLAFLSMAQMRSGHVAAARETLARMRERAAKNERQLDKEVRALMAECESIVNERELKN
jgi:hypothetical protein